jgi:hypothetical protein
LVFIYYFDSFLGLSRLRGEAYLGHQIALGIHHGTIAGGGGSLQLRKDVGSPSGILGHEGGIKVGGVPINIHLAGA